MSLDMMTRRVVKTVILKMSEEYLDDDDKFIEFQYSLPDQACLLTLTVIPQSGTQPFAITERLTDKELNLPPDDKQVALLEMAHRVKEHLINGIDLYRYKRPHKPRFEQPDSGRSLAP